MLRIAGARGASSRPAAALFALVGTLVVGCAGPGGPAGASSGSPPVTRGGPGGPAETYIREVAPFPVVGADGVPFEHPFLGGYNLPRPQLVDIDGDGDDDLFVQEQSGRVAFFEHVPDGTPRFQWRTDHFQELDVGEWFRFVDVDRDGDPDLLAERPYSYVRYYRNEGGPTDPRFVPAADSLRDASGTPIFSDRQNIPNATDIDCDGRMDLLIGRLTGTITRYEEIGTDENDVPIFELVTDRFEDIEIIGQILGSLHGANTMAFGDVDDDGDEDLFWGDFFEPGVLLLENRGTCQSPSFRGQPQPFPLGDPLRTSGYNAPTLGDATGSPLPDLLVGVLGGAFNPNSTSIDNLHLLEHVEPGRFVPRTSRFVSMIDVGSESAPMLLDVDGDGDLDLLVSNKIRQDDPDNGSVTLFRNEGSPTAPRFVHEGFVDLGPGYNRVAAFGDLDGDGRPDAIVGGWADRMAWYRDGGGGPTGLVLVDSAFVRLPRGRNALPTLGDLDGDGDLDLLVGEASGTVNHFENTGTPERPEFTLLTEDFAGIDAGRRAAPLLHDLDGDGDLDLLVGTEADGVQVHRNVGTRTEPIFEFEGFLDVTHHGLSVPALGDVDGDGTDDLFLGSTGGGLLFFRGGGR